MSLPLKGLQDLGGPFLALKADSLRVNLKSWAIKLVGVIERVLVMNGGKNFYYFILSVERVGKGVLSLSSGGCVEGKDGGALSKEGLSD